VEVEALPVAVVEEVEVVELEVLEVLEVVVVVEVVEVVASVCVDCEVVGGGVGRTADDADEHAYQAPAAVVMGRRGMRRCAGVGGADDSGGEEGAGSWWVGCWDRPEVAKVLGMRVNAVVMALGLEACIVQTW
jgi:hypothetical protein